MMQPCSFPMQREIVESRLLKRHTCFLHWLQIGGVADGVRCAAHALCVPHLNGMRCACCSATHSLVMVDMLNRRCTHQQLSRASMPARITRTLQDNQRDGVGHYGQELEGSLG